MTDGNAQLFVATHNGMAIRLQEDKIRPISRSAHGVKAIKLRDGDYVVSMARIREGASLLTVTDKGFGKRTDIENYRIQNRGGFGLTNYKVDDERGHVCGIKVVDESDDIILVSSEGVIIRIRCADIRIMGRIAKGVRVMRVQDDSSVVAFTRTDHDDDEELAEVEQLSDEQLLAEEAEAEIEEKNEIIIESPENPDDDDDNDDNKDNN